MNLEERGEARKKILSVEVHGKTLNRKIEKLHVEDSLKLFAV